VILSVSERVVCMRAGMRTVGLCLRVQDAIGTENDVILIRLVVKLRVESVV
jgi:hypothetical protein